MLAWPPYVNRLAQLRSNQKPKCCASVRKIRRSLDTLEGYLADGTLKTDTLNLATIAIACAIGYLNFRRIAPGGAWKGQIW
ncbi:glutathione binding-like protein [Escherichia coli]